MLIQVDRYDERNDCMMGNDREAHSVVVTPAALSAHIATWLLSNLHNKWQQDGLCRYNHHMSSLSKLLNILYMIYISYDIYIICIYI